MHYTIMTICVLQLRVRPTLRVLRSLLHPYSWLFYHNAFEIDVDFVRGL